MALFDWAPRWGPSGDDRYLWSDASFRDGALDYSSPPTVAELRARDGFNQAVAAAKLRIAANSRILTDSLAYRDETAIKATDFSSLKSAIDAIRSAEYLSASSFANHPYTAGNPMRGVDIKDLRVGLETDCISLRGDGRDLNYQGFLNRQGLAYPPVTFSTKSNSSQAALGRDFASSTYDSWRTFVTFFIPSGLTLASAQLRLYIFSKSISGAGVDFDVKIIETGDWGTLDTGDWTFGTSSTPATFNTSGLTATTHKTVSIPTGIIPIGGVLKLAIVHGDEHAGSGWSPGSTALEHITVDLARTFLDLTPA